MMSLTSGSRGEDGESWVKEQLFRYQEAKANLNLMGPRCSLQCYWTQLSLTSETLVGR